MKPPKTQYTRSGDVNVAYPVIGDGPVDLAYSIGWTSNIDILWKEPSYGDFLRRLASFSRLIGFDKRGTGLSNRGAHQLKGVPGEWRIYEVTQA